MVLTSLLAEADVMLEWIKGRPESVSILIWKFGQVIQIQWTPKLVKGGGGCEVGPAPAPARAELLGLLLVPIVHQLHEVTS